MDNKPNTEQFTADTRKIAFTFNGDGMEYFKIWIVNILLTIVTLGVFSAWAKVRNHRYFYSNLELDGSHFRYLADPITILKGRLLAVAAFLVYMLATKLLPIIAIILALALSIAIPHLINLSLAFNARMSAYKNIQFRFKGNYKESFVVFFIWPIIGAFTFGLLYPLAILKMNEYIVNNSYYGTTSFEFNATFGDYFKIFLVAFGLVMAALILGGIVGAIAGMIHPALGTISAVLMILGYLIGIAYVFCGTTNLYYASTTLDKHGFTANLATVGYIKVYLINALLITVTLGLYLPAAKVRMTKYICENLTFNASGSLDHYIAGEQDNVNAVGEEFGQVFDFGV